MRGHPHVPAALSPGKDSPVPSWPTHISNTKCNPARIALHFTNKVRLWGLILLKGTQPKQKKNTVMFWDLTLVTDTQVTVANIHFKCTLHCSWACVHFTSFQPSFYGQNLRPWHCSLRHVSSNYIRQYGVKNYPVTRAKQLIFLRRVFHTLCRCFTIPFV